MHQRLIKNLETINYPGLSDHAEEIPGLAADLAKKTAIFVYKQDQPLLWVTILGGTGTGKSTIFNALCGRHISQTGMERPKTQGPIAFAHQNSPIGESFPLKSIRIDRHPLESDQTGPIGGAEGLLTIVDHNRPDWCRWVLVDSPDLDSIAPANREMSRDLYLLSDAVIFVTSQEKYADEVPSQLLKQVIHAKKPYFLLLNKVQNRSAKEELIKTVQNQEISIRADRIWPIDYESSHAPDAVAGQPGFREFALVFSDILSEAQQHSFRKVQIENRIRHLSEDIDYLLQLLEKEDVACRDWLQRLDRLYHQTSQALIQNESERFTQKNREYLRAEIRRLFARYDVLAKPRRIIKEILLLPLRFIGYRKDPDEKNHKEAILKLKEKFDLSAVEAAIELFNRSVLENLSPQSETLPLNKKLHQRGMALEYEEICDRTLKEHERLTAWLEDKFKTLSQGLPKGKQWGIYSASIAWGILLLSLEIAIGGGFTVLDALLDSALAPFITKGTMELFAYQEIQKIVRELSNRYQKVLLAALSRQHEAYKKCLLSLEIKKETIERLTELQIFLTTDSTHRHRS